MTSLVRVTTPAIEPVTVAEAKAHLGLSDVHLEPVPSAPTVALASAGAGNVDAGRHRYRLTFVTADGETDGGDVSEAVEVVDASMDGRVALTNIPVGGSAVIARRVFRTRADVDGAFYLVGALMDNLTTVFTDNVADAGLGVGVPSTNTTGDALVQRTITSAREIVEDWLRRALITQQWRLSLDCFPYPADGMQGGARIFLPRSPLVSVDEVSYLDLLNTRQILDPSYYVVKPDALPGHLALAYLKLWPITLPYYDDAVQVMFTAGFGDSASAVPSSIRQAILLLVGDMYEDRSTYITGTIVNELPTVKRLLQAWRVPEAH